MSINRISGSNPAYQSQQSNSYNGIRNDFKNLGNALNSGNITDAQTAFATILQSLQSNSGNFGSGNGQISTDFTALQNALQSGNITSAQKAYSTLQQYMHSVHGHRHHHKADGQGNNSADSTSTLQNTFQMLLADLGSLQSTISTGSSSDAQNVLDTLQNNGSLDLLNGNSQTSQAI